MMVNTISAKSYQYYLLHSVSKVQVQVQSSSDFKFQYITLFVSPTGKPELSTNFIWYSLNKYLEV